MSKRRPSSDEHFHQKAVARMEKIDAQPPEIRAIVHEEGWRVVEAFLLCGVTKARHIKHLIQVVREGSSAYSNGTRGERMREIPTATSEAKP